MVNETKQTACGNTPGETPEAYAIEDILDEYRAAPAETEEAPPLADGPPPDPPREDALPPELAEEAPLPREILAEALRASQPPDPPPAPPETELARLREMVGPRKDGAGLDDAGTGPLSPPRRGLFSRRQDAGVCPAPAETEEPPRRRTLPEMPGETEPALSAAAVDSREDLRAGRRCLIRALALTLPPLAAMAAEYGGLSLPFWTGDRTIQGPVFLSLLLLTLLICRSVAMHAFAQLRAGRFTGQLFAVFAALAAAADCALWTLAPQRGDAPPYAAAALLALCFAQWGLCRELRGNYDCFRTAAMDDPPPYLVTETARGACKQRGSVPGFYASVLRADYAARLQAVFLPLIFVAALVFAVMTALERGRGETFFLNVSALLLAGGTFSLPLCWALPWARLTRRQQRSGCALAGWDGASRISRRHLILTDTDLFPPGTVRFGGVKVYGEELSRAAAYAAAMACAAGSGLGRVFAELAVAEGAAPETAEDVSFYEEGGWEGTIRGESVLMGTAPFLLRRGVRLPELTLPTGVFLAVDGVLTAVFALKYEPAENVDYALRMLRRCRMVPVLAVRDPNITPALLKRKFHRGVRVSFPDLTERVALSEAREDRGLPRALLLREGLLPYAEAVAGSRRLRTAVRRCAWLSLLGSAAGLLLTAYLLSLEKFDLLTPAALTVFLLLWTLPVLLIGDWTGRF